MNKEKKPIVDIKDAEDVLGKEGIDKIVDKEWKVAELPSEEDIKKEEHESSMARNNVNSRKNLIQYKKNKPKETKEKIVKNLKYPSTRKERDLVKFFGDLIDENMLGIFEPVRAVLNGDEEDDLFFTTIKYYLSDFSKGDLTASDIDDIASLAINRILELRLLAQSKGKPKNILDCSTTIEKFRKNSDKIKMSLASRRVDRVDTRQKTGFSIVDIATAFDDEKRKELKQRVLDMELEEKELADKKAKNLTKIDE
jgi:hypothetical protein